MPNSTVPSYTAADTAPTDAESQIDKAAPVLLAGADTISASALQQLSQVQQARAARLTRTANVAVAQFGANSPQAANAQASVAATKVTAARLAVAGQQVSTAAPTVAADGWALQGRVYDSNLSPLAGYSVFLADSQKNYLSTFGFAYTDSTGYFLINYAPAASSSASSPSTPAPEAGAAAPEAGAAAPVAGAAAPAASSPMFLEVADTSANPVYLSSTAFVPVQGQAVYQTITLPAGGTELGDPPATVRAVALPPENAPATARAVAPSQADPPATARAVAPPQTKKGWRPPGQ